MQSPHNKNLKLNLACDRALAPQNKLEAVSHHRDTYTFTFIAALFKKPGTRGGLDVHQRRKEGNKV